MIRTYSIVVKCHVIHCNHFMIASFRDTATEDVFSGEAVLAFPQEMYARARRKLFATEVCG